MHTPIFFVIALFLLPSNSFAYMGPSLGLGLIGFIVTVFVVIGLTIYALIIAPILKLMRKNKLKKESKIKLDHQDKNEN